PAILSEGPKEARKGQRSDGLAQYPILPRLWLWTDQPATLSAPQAPKRGGAQRCRRMGTARRKKLAADSQRPLDRAQKPISLWQRTHHCRLFRRRSRIDWGAGRLRLLCLSQYQALA